MKILLISGWGLGTQVLNEFVQQLEQQLTPQHQIEVWDIFDPNNAAVLAEKVQAAADKDVLIGWSLGGQLALLLANAIYQQIQVTKPVIACMSNPCFVAQENWLHAMPKVQYEQFKHAVMLQPQQALKRFSALVTLGSVAPRERAKHLQEQSVNIDLSYQQAHLYLLEQLNLVDILKSYPGKMLFINSENDMLVPYKVIQNIAHFNADHLNLVKISAAHDAILFDTSLVIEPILQFLQKLR
ncbi:alpha/beta hydrolase [Acinetobacter schindleri]|uniref:alpha/beta hydrolase n=1 Tax=Acinetobacter schindleri TaxID=108981 RepID=UPI001621114C|nr:alpha/beta hydrolase [Acinetobacter schindleri]MBB4835577.1 pimeloyl-[acyl-carrier protein] methyl ester esterase [Acinetobacter schindleri]WBX37385.1 alpha/beta hydrolase [Acinetobacter schindleri]